MDLEMETIGAKKTWEEPNLIIAKDDDFHTFIKISRLEIT
jgi:hypothetical protein